MHKALHTASLVVALMIGGCAGKTPIDVSATTIDEYDNLIDLPFVTNRAIEPMRGDRRFFGNRLGDLSGGYCYVGVDDGDDGDGHLLHVATRGMDEIFSDLSKHAARGIVVYVHGFNMSFKRSCRHAATLKRQLGVSGGLLLFTWPSKSTLVTYRGDIENMQQSADKLFSLLDDLGRRYGRDNVNIVAHSLGSRGVLDSLEAWQPGDSPFAQLILIAPDIDREMFIDALPALKERIDKVSVIVSDRDRTLLVSQTVNLGPRLGQFDGVDIEGVDLVDVTDIEGSHFTGHIYHLRNEQVAALIRGMLFGEPGS